MHGRGAPWEKIRIVQELAAAYDLVLWVDADAAFVDISMDIAQCLGRRDLMALCGHRTPEGAVIPNTGIWVLRSGRRTDRFLEDVWNATEFLDHKWWENSAVIDRLGFEVGPPCVVRKLTPMVDGPRSWAPSGTALRPTRRRTRASCTSRPCPMTSAWRD